MKKINWKEWRSFAVIALVIFTFRSMAFEPFRIPSGSMIPTLNIGDFILVNKFAYGLKVPFSDMFSNPIYMTNFESPKRDDVIIFKYPPEPNLTYIKRVVGLPGDEVELISKQVYVNGRMIPTTPESTEMLKSFADSFDGVKVSVFKVKDQGREFNIQTTSHESRVDNLPKFKVPDGHYFVMGDNRDFSADSRYWGFVPKENIKGRALLVWMSMTLPLLDSGFSFSPSRIGRMIN